MKIKIKSIMIIVLVFIMTVLLYNSYSFAGIIDDATSFLEAGVNANNTNTSVPNQGAMKSTINDVASLLTGLGIIVAVVVGVILGIQFMTGSIEQQAKVKESIIPYVCGCVVIFGALTIWQLIIKLFNSAI